MTKGQLGLYRSMKREITELEHKLGNLGKGGSMPCSAVANDYRQGYPMPQAVVGGDWKRYGQQKARCEERIRALRKECDAIESYVEEGIGDSLTRRIFRMYFLEGRTQKEIAKLIHMDRSTVSRRLNAPAR